MDPQGCFSAPHLPNQGNVLSTFRSFTENAYPHILSYNMQHHDTAAIFAADGKEDSELYPGVKHSAGNALRFPSVMRKNNSSISATDFHKGKGENEAADLSVKNNCPPGDGFPNPNNTRLLREILQGKKTAEEIMEEDQDGASNPASDFDDESASKNGDESEEHAAESGHNPANDSTDAQKVKRARVENIVSSIRAPSNGTCISGASSENSGSISDSRKGKRKQFRPQQLDGDQPPNAEKEIMRKQLDMMQDQIEVMQERYSTLFEATNGDSDELHNGHGGGGEKRKRDEFPDLQDDLIKMHTLSAVQAALNGVGPTEVGKLASLITAEINEQINPIIKSVINKYFPIKVGEVPNAGHPTQNSRSPSPSRDSQNRSPSRSPVRPTKVTDKQRQPLNTNNEMHARKQFAPPMCLGYPPPPVIGNENKLHFLSMAAMAPTMYGPGFQNLFRSGYFPEQTEAIPLVVQQKKKRHKVTDTRISPRVINKVMSQKEEQMDVRKFMQTSPSPLSDMYNMNGNLATHGFFGGPRNIRQNALNHSESSPFYPSMQLDQARQMMMSSSFYARQNLERDISSPMNGSVDSPDDQNNDQNSIDFSDTESATGNNGRQPTFSQTDSSYPLSSTLTPMHLRKAKLMFFYTRYPNSATLKTYFPDIKFNKNNTAQLVKWFSNFREFYYNVMEKYAKEAIGSGIKKAEDIHVEKDSEIFRVLNLHYNRNNHTEVPEPFRDVVEESLRQFFIALQSGRNQEPSWKKAIYKVINRMDDVIPDYFKSPHFMEELE